MATIPSIAMIPSGHKANKVYSVLPTDGSGDLTFARASTATRINKNNLIENVGNNVPRLDYTDGSCPSLLLEPSSTNLITQSESFLNNYWTKTGASIQGNASTAGVDLLSGWDFTSGWATSNSVVNDLNTFTTSSANGSVRKGYLTIDAFYLLNTNSSSDIGQVEIYSRNVDGSTSLISVGSGVFYFISSGTELLVRNTLSGATTDVTTLEVKEVTGFSVPSVDSPLGAFKLVEDTSTGYHSVNLTDKSPSDGNIYTRSFYVKKDTARYIGISARQSFSSSSTTWIYDFDTNSWAQTGSTGSGEKIEALSNGWIRLSVSHISSSNFNNDLALGLSSGTTTGDLSYTGDGTSGVYIFGAQLEEQSSATSYIPTAGTIISRTADSASKSGISSLINSSEGVLFVNASSLVNGMDGRITISDGTINNRVSIEWDATANTIKSFMGTNGEVSSTSFNQTDNLKIALSYKENDFKLYINGSLADSDSSANVLSAMNKLYFSNYNNANPFYGKAKDLRIYDTALTDAELAALTTI